MNINHPVFIGHGSPMNILYMNQYTTFLNNYGNNISKPKAIIVISAHWQTQGTFITGHEHPEQLYDFYGFPDKLYQVKYMPKGEPNLATELERGKLGIQIDKKRGIDHAGWAIVMHLFPQGHIPLLEISLDVHKSPEEHYELGRKLAPFSEQGILFIGSGNLVHNLRDVTFEDNAQPFRWATEADKWFKESLESGRIEELINYKSHLPNFQRPIPTDEHYLPLLYILGMKKQDQRIETIYEEIQNGSISMRSIRV